MDGAGLRPVDVAVLIVVRAKVAVLLPRGQDVGDSAQQDMRHGNHRERKEMSSRVVASDPATRMGSQIGVRQELPRPPFCLALKSAAGPITLLQVKK